MRRLKSALRLASAVAAMVIAGCVNAPPPTINLEGRHCTTTMDLTRPLTLMVEVDKEITSTLDDAAACLQAADGTRSVYSVLKLPPFEEPYVVSVASIPLGPILFSPRLVMIDRNGQILRELPNASFIFRGSALHAAVRVRRGEDYLVIASDASSIGKQISRIATTRNSTVLPVGTGFVAIHSGNETVETFTYAHNGRVTVSARLLPKVN